MDVALGIICFVLICASLGGGFVAYYRAQNQLRHGRSQEFERVDLRRQGYKPKDTLKPIKASIGR